MSDQLEKAVLDELQKGRKINAVKVLRKLRGISLKEAKDIIDLYEVDNSINSTVVKAESGNKLGILVIIILAVVIYLVDTDKLAFLKSFFSTLPKLENSLVTQPSTSGNLVINSGFDYDLSSWVSRGDTKHFSHINDKGNLQHGAMLISSTVPENSKKHIIYEAKISQCIELDNGTLYRFSANFKPTGSYLSQYTNRVNIIWYQESGCTARGEFGSYLEPKIGTDNWQHIERRVTRSLNAQAARIEITQNKVSANGVPALWDDIELIPIEFKKTDSIQDTSEYSLPAGENYLKNHDFSSNLEHWRFSGKTTWQSNEGSNLSGAARLAITSDKGGYGAYGFSQCINLGKPRVFSFNAKVRVDPTSTFKGGGIFRLSWYENLACSGRRQAGFKEDRVEYTDGWQSIGVDEIVAPDNVASAMLYFTRGIDDSGLFAYFVDDVVFTAKP